MTRFDSACADYYTKCFTQGIQMLPVSSFSLSCSWQKSTLIKVLLSMYIELKTYVLKGIEERFIAYSTWWTVSSSLAVCVLSKDFVLLLFSFLVMSDSLPTPWIAAHQAFLYLCKSQSLLKFMSIESVMPSNHLILCCPLLLLPSIFPSIRVFSNELALPIRWPKYWSFSFHICLSNEYSGLISFRIDWFDLFWSPCSPRASQVFSNTTVQTHQFFSTQPSLWSNSHPYRTTGKP